MKLVPLRIDSQAEDARRSDLPSHRRFLKWLSQYSPFLIYYEVPYGRRSVETQLKARSGLPIEAWCLTKLPLATVKELCHLLQQRMNWPNANFYPCDPIQLLLLEEYDEFASNEFFIDIRDHLGITVSNSEIEELCRESQTLEGFVRELLTKNPQKPTITH